MNRRTFVASVAATAASAALLHNAEATPKQAQDIYFNDQVQRFVNAEVNHIEVDQDSYSFSFAYIPLAQVRDSLDFMYRAYFFELTPNDPDFRFDPYTANDIFQRGSTSFEVLHSMGYVYVGSLTDITLRKEFVKHAFEIAQPWIDGERPRNEIFPHKYEARWIGEGEYIFA